MRIMGLPNWLHWTAWFCKSFITIFIAVIIMVILLTVKWYPNSEYTIFTHSNPILIFIILGLFTCATITFSFAISSLASKANIGATIAGIGWFLLYAPYMSLQYNYDQVSFPVKIITSLFSNSAIGFTFRLLIKLENTGVGLQWNNVWAPIEGDDILVGHTLIMLLVDFILYFLIAIYIEAVFPGQYGVAKPWYFFLNIFNFRRKLSEVDDEIKDNTNLMNHEKEPTHLPADIKIKNLRKVYGKMKVAVENLSLNMYRDQITVLLGHNGAGKSTTISILTGMISPSNGTALVGGNDVRTNIEGVRDSLGFCPQHNILFDELTVEEHLYFYCRLKGVPKHEVENEISKYLVLLEFTQKAKTPANKLSGGMKRKLSIGIAFCGNSKVVVCDEPSAGMDPSARRALWDLLLAQKKGRTILLTTHFMDEADLLGDRIAIMANGKLECSGSSFFLKKRYGAGYRLILDKSPECDVNKVTELLGKYIANINVHSNIGSELTYILNDQHLSVFEKMLGELENKSANLNIRSYGISLTTLQDVFIKVGSGRQETNEIVDYERSRSFLESDQESGSQLSIEVPVPKTKFLLISWDLWKNQILAMFIKRVLSITRSWLLLLIQISIPVIFLVITLSIPFYSDTNDNFPRIVFTLSRYVDPTTLVTRDTINNAYSRNYMKMLDSMDKKYINFENGNVHIKAIEEAEKDISIYNTRYIAGATFNSNNSITAMFSNQPYHGSPLALQLVLNAILKTEVSPDYNIFVYNHPLPYTINTKFVKLFEINNMGYQIAFNLGFSMAFVSAFYVMFYVQERSSKFKHLQFVSGIDVLSFWIPSFVCDLLTSILTCVGAIITLAIFQENGFRTFYELGRVFILYITFTFGSLPLMYISSYWHTVPSSGYVRMALVNVLLGTGGFMVVDIFNNESLELQHIAVPLKWIFLLMPHYCFNAGLRDISIISSTQYLCDTAIETCQNINITDVVNREIPLELCKLIIYGSYKECREIPAYFSIDSPGVGKYVLFSCIMGVVFFTLLLLTEYNIFNKILSKFQRSQASVVKRDNDEDVSKENQDIAYVISIGNERKYNLVLHNVSKNYNKLMAVNNISLGVTQKECFGLLGVNGAGKTTTFRMITGDLKMSAGDVWVNGWNIKQDLKKVYQLIGYCPQFDALLDDLTCKETLTIFSLLRGVRRKDCPELIETLSRDFDFYQHLDKKVKQLSGGNKRKLSTALALVGDPLVLYLDEPTAGVDPATKRYLWNALCKIRDRGTTIVLTSHSMEECEALCTRLAIMVNGSFKCLGSTQHLKSKFSDGYTLMIKSKTFNTDQQQKEALDQIEKFVKYNFEEVSIREIHQEMMSFYISNKDQIWSKMFGVIERGKTILPIEDYTLGQCSLEQVFLTFTNQQREEDIKL